MPGRGTLTKRIFDQVDVNKVPVQKWAKEHGNTSICCTLCSRKVSVGSNGIWLVNQHAKGANHKALSDARYSENQTRFGFSTGEMVKSLQDYVCEAEVLWAFKVAEEDWNFKSCDSLDKLFQRMFSNDVSAKFGVSRTKMSYGI